MSQKKKLAFDSSVFPVHSLYIDFEVHVARTSNLNHPGVWVDYNSNETICWRIERSLLEAAKFA